MTPQIFPTYEQSKFLLALVKTYRKFPSAIAILCDEELDRSGSLLGVVREFAQSPKDIQIEREKCEY